MPKEPPRILAVNPGSRYVGFAAFRGPELLDWGVRVIRANTPRGQISVGKAILFEAIERFQPEVLAIKHLHQSRTSGRLNDLASAMILLSRRRRMHVCQYSIGEMKHAFRPEPTSTRELARQVAAMYPVLIHDFERELQNRHPYYLKMFEAVALGVVCYQQLEE